MPGADILPMRNLHTPEYRAFLGRLRKARLQAGLTQVQVAEGLGLRQSEVSRMESGERRVDFVELVRFARLYRRHLDYFAEL